MASAELSRRVEKVVGYSRSPTASRASARFEHHTDLDDLPATDREDEYQRRYYDAAATVALAEDRGRAGSAPIRR